MGIAGGPPPPPPNLTNRNLKKNYSLLLCVCDCLFGHLYCAACPEVRGQLSFSPPLRELHGLNLDFLTFTASTPFAEPFS